MKFQRKKPWLKNHGFKVSIKCLAEFAAAAANKVRSCFAATHPRVVSLAPLGQFTSCAWQNIPLRLRVCELCAKGAWGPHKAILALWGEEKPEHSRSFPLAEKVALCLVLRRSALSRLPTLPSESPIGDFRRPEAMAEKPLHDIFAQGIKPRCLDVLAVFRCARPFSPPPWPPFSSAVPGLQSESNSPGRDEKSPSANGSGSAGTPSGHSPG